MVSVAHEIERHLTSLRVTEAILKIKIDMIVSSKAIEYNNVSWLHRNGAVLACWLQESVGTQTKILTLS
jgi:hypothetical protein